METVLGVTILSSAAVALARIVRAAWQADTTARIARQAREARREQWRRAGADLPPKVQHYLESL